MAGRSATGHPYGTANVVVVVVDVDVVDVDGGGALQRQRMHGAGGAQPCKTSHCSPAPTSTMPSPHLDRVATNWRAGYRLALSTPTKVLHTDPVSACSRTPASGPHEAHFPNTWVPCVVGVTLPLESGQSLSIPTS